ncbi:hypothetical protein HZS_761 [Henneguya salminicola]|nr:hypothetical protein HZS_761 [Henneguya salminicola]
MIRSVSDCVLNFYEIYKPISVRKCLSLSTTVCDNMCEPFVYSLRTLRNFAVLSRFYFMNIIYQILAQALIFPFQIFIALRILIEYIFFELISPVVFYCSNKLMDNAIHFVNIFLPIDDHALKAEDQIDTDIVPHLKKIEPYLLKPERLGKNIILVDELNQKTHTLKHRVKTFTPKLIEKITYFFEPRESKTFSPFIDINRFPIFFNLILCIEIFINLITLKTKKIKDFWVTNFGIFKNLFKYGSFYVISYPYYIAKLLILNYILKMKIFIILKYFILRLAGAISCFYDTIETSVRTKLTFVNLRTLNMPLDYLFHLLITDSDISLSRIEAELNDVFAAASRQTNIAFFDVKTEKIN